jgi:hypothetical protein
VGLLHFRLRFFSDQARKILKRGLYAKLSNRESRVGVPTYFASSTNTAVPYARTSVTPCMSSVAS